MMTHIWGVSLVFWPKMDLFLIRSPKSSAISCGRNMFYKIFAIKLIEKTTCSSKYNFKGTREERMRRWIKLVRGVTENPEMKMNQRLSRSFDGEQPCTLSCRQSRVPTTSIKARNHLGAVLGWQEQGPQSESKRGKFLLYFHGASGLRREEGTLSRVFEERYGKGTSSC